MSTAANFRRRHRYPAVWYLNTLAAIAGASLFADTWVHAVGLWLMIESVLMTIESTVKEA